LLAALWPSGGVSGGATTVVTNTMTVSVAPGKATVPLVTGQGAALCTWDAPEVVTIAAAPPSGQSRIDLIVVQVRDHDLDGGANNDFIVTSVLGTPAASNPVAPAVPVNALALCNVTVPGAAANLNAATLMDRRPRGHVEVSTINGFNLPNSVWSVIPFEVLESSPIAVAEWDNTNHRYVCPWPGRYLVTSTISMSTATPVQQFHAVAVYKNGTGVRNGTTVGPTSQYIVAAANVAAIVQCVAGDHLQIAATNGGGGWIANNAVGSFAAFTYQGP
jgi:hypothetical protein